MAAITTRATAGTGATVKGSPLTNAEIDTNFININTDVVAALASSGVTAGTYTKVTVDVRGRVTAGASLASADLPTYTGTITSSQITAGLGFTPVSKTGDTFTGAVNVRASGSVGYITLATGTTTNSGYMDFTSAAGVRQGYIGFSGTTAAADTGTIPYVAGLHAFTGNMTVSGTFSATSLSGTITSSQVTTALGYTPLNPTTSQTGSTVYAAPDGANGAPAFRNLVLTDLPDAWVKRSAKVATTANITLSATQTIDGVAVVVGDRVLVKNQTTASQNGIYIVAAGAWTRAPDANTASKIAGAHLNVDSGTVNGGKSFDTDFKTTDTLDTTAITFSRNLDMGAVGVDIQAYNALLDAVSGLTGTGFVKKTGATALGIDTATYLTANQTVTLSGDATGSGGTAITVTLAASGVTAGTYTKVTVDAKGRVTVGASLASADLPTYTGTITSAQVTTGLGYTPVNPTTSQTAKFFWAAPNGAAGAPTFRAIVASDIPTLNQNTTGSAGSCTGNSATVTITADNATATSQPVLFASTTSGSLSPKGSTGLNYVASTSTLVATGNVTAYSDERVKTNWKPMGYDFVYKLSLVKSGTFDRTDIETPRQVGVGAQSLQEVIPEAVTEVEGILTVNYGAAAMVSVVELSKLVLELKKEVASLKSRILDLER